MAFTEGADARATWRFCPGFLDQNPVQGTERGHHRPVSHVEGVGKGRSRSTMNSVWHGLGWQPQGHRPEKYCHLCQLFKYPQGTQSQPYSTHRGHSPRQHTSLTDTFTAVRHLQEELSDSMHTHCRNCQAKMHQSKMLSGQYKPTAEM